MEKIFLLLFLITYSVQGQVGIGTNNPDTSAKLDVSATDKGFLMPRMTSSQRTAISEPANGLLVYQTNGETGFYVNVGTSDNPVWKRVNVDWIKSGNNISYTSGDISTTGSLTGGNSNTSSISGFTAKVISITQTSTLNAEYNGKIIQSDNTNPITVTIPTGLPTGFNCTIVQMGTGQVTFSGTYLNRGGFTKTASQYAVVSIMHLGNNKIIVAGEMSN
jgi:hypothetical protein